MDYFSEKSTQILTVTELNRAVKNLLENEYTDIRLKGEVSGLQTAQSGHTYFKLKDQSAEIDCALFRGTATRLRNIPAEGLEVILTGQVTLYPNRGRYQFVVSGVELKDEGELYKAFLERQRLLEKEGYFDSDRKRELPAFPNRVGVITSPTGAAVQDVIRAFKRRNPSISLLIYPAAVQGEGAAKQIADAINIANRRKSEDVLIVTRGGGSIEDLWAFNEVAVADAIYRSELPIITGIGHETDTTIAEFVADVRAATPTAAAERVSTTTRDNLLEMLTNREVRLSTLMSGKINELAQNVDLTQKGLVHPAQRIQNQQAKFELIENRLLHITGEQLNSYSTRLMSQNQRLFAASPKSKIELLDRKFSENMTLLKIHFSKRIRFLANRVENLQARLESANPSTALSRGFSIIRRAEDNSVVSHADTVSIGDKVRAQLSDGSLNLEVDSIDT